MGKSTRITLADASAVLRLTHSVRDLRGDAPTQHRRLLDGMAGLVDADDATAWAVRHFRRGGPTAFVRFVLSTDGDPTFRAYMADLATPGGMTPETDPFADNAIDDRAPRRTVGFWDAVGPESRLGRYPLAADLMRSSRFTDGLFAVRRSPTPDPDVGGDDLPLGFTLHRFGGGGRRRYTGRERSVFDFAVSEVVRLMGLGVLADPSSRPLPPRQAEVLRRVLAGEAPKEMARAMGLSVHTVREHLSRLYARHGVEGREELTAAVTRPPG